MKIISQTPKKALKVFLKQKPIRSEIDLFKAKMTELLDKTNQLEKQNIDESEEHLKNYLRDFLLDTYYKGTNEVNTKDRKDLVIHLENSTSSNVAVIIEAKRPSNKSEMINEKNPNTKALHEIILYYFDERESCNNIQLKNLIITNIYEWYIFDVNYFDKHIYRNSKIKKLYDIKVSEKKDNPFFYENLQNILQSDEFEIPCIYFDIRNYDKILRNNRIEDDKELIALYKILSPRHLLKIATINDSNTLDFNFYKELLYIIGLEEVSYDNKLIIRRVQNNPNPASLIELTISQLKTELDLQTIPNIENYGDTDDEKYFNIALELCITWINRILFLKLLEGQLVAYHSGDKKYKFLNIDIIDEFDELFNLFHRVLAVNYKDRNKHNQTHFSHIPYLNSSLFEISELERHTIRINTLQNNQELDFFGSTVLKDYKKTNKKLVTLDYLFKFLNAYDFASEGTEDILEDRKTLINASVLGKVFEKINGYKDGSFFTPDFITMFICQQSIRLAVIQKFKDKYGWKIASFEDLKNFLVDRRTTKDILQFNDVVNSLRICDPAVGSGHFLVSALNELILIKYELGILADSDGNRIRGLDFSIVNDELIITNENGDFFEYKIHNGKPLPYEMHRVQKTLFHEKQNLIENCLFGVDINPNSAKICRLRLWIELLKNAYYKEPDYIELETLPNIDINIKCGDSLISRFALDDSSPISQADAKIIPLYKEAVRKYKRTSDSAEKRRLLLQIDNDKSQLKGLMISKSNKAFKLLEKKSQLNTLIAQNDLFDSQKSDREKQEYLKQVQTLTLQIQQLDKEISDINNNPVYRNAFEWRFEFPEVLDDGGNYEGFDIIIGNPPYIQLQKEGARLANMLEQLNYKTFARTGDIYTLFYERGLQLLKNNGILAFITSNKWMRAGYGEKLRNFLASKSQPLKLIDFGGYKVFDAATVDTNILITKKVEQASLLVNNNNNLIDGLNNHNQSGKSQSEKSQSGMIDPPFYACTIAGDFKSDTSIADYFERHKQLMPQMDKSAWIISSDIETKIKQKIEAFGTPLKDWDIKINYGIKTGFNEAFIIDGKKKDELIAQDPKSAEIIKPILRGRDIKRYKANFADLWLINSHNGIKDKGIPRIDVPKDYPAIYNHLKKYEKELIKRQDKGDHWTNLRNCAYLEEFEKEKIVWTPVNAVYYFTIVEPNYYFNNSIFMITSNNQNIILKYLLSIFNSKFYTKYIDIILDLGNYQYASKNTFEKFKIPLISSEEQKPFENLVTEILRKKEIGEETEAEEREIDHLVYQLYNLTEEEIAIIEKNN